jgi:hypothetical protein
VAAQQKVIRHAQLVAEGAGVFPPYSLDELFYQCYSSVTRIQWEKPWHRPDGESVLQGSSVAKAKRPNVLAR